MLVVIFSLCLFSAWSSAQLLPLVCPVASGSCPDQRITYLLYNNRTGDSPYQLDPSTPSTLSDAPFTKDPLKVLIHGFDSSVDDEPNTSLRPAYLQRGYNVLVVDWAPLAEFPCYLSAADNCLVVGECTAQLLNLVYRANPNVQLNNTHVVGHSLGAQAAGSCGLKLNGKLPRITGLDPAGPLFYDFMTPASRRLDSTDAVRVEGYHTNSGLLGTPYPVGHVDVFFGDGTNQPGCNCVPRCSHNRSNIYYAESITSSMGLYGFLCDSYASYFAGQCRVNSTADLVRLGEDIDSSVTGRYISFTNTVEPYLRARSSYVDDPDYGKHYDGLLCGLL